MPYQINLYNGTPLVVVDDGTTNNRLTSLTLVGKNYAGYGEIQNENFVYLLENFSNINSPSNALTGQIWYDLGNQKLKFYNGTSWRTTGGAEVGSIQPPSLTVGDFWFNTATDQLYSWNGTEAVLIGPQGVANAGQTNLESVSVNDINGYPHAIVEAVINGSVVSIFSVDSFDLDPNSNQNLVGFNHINKGITLINSTTGSTTTQGSPSTNFRFWGTASDSDKLAGLSSSSYVLAASAIFTGLAKVQVDAGLTVGLHDDLKIYLTGSAVPTVENTVSNTISFKVTQNSLTREPLKLVGITAVPGEDITYDLGSAILRWKDIYGQSIYATNLSVSNLTVSGGNINGTSNKADRLFYNNATTQDKYVLAHDGGTGGTSVVNETIVVRNSQGNFGANIVYATATQARYADLAEKYEADAEYDAGTVVVFGGEKEITITDIQADHRVAGVISTNPAYLMNNTEETESFLPVALRGKVPVKVIGKVKKGDILITSNEKGYAVSAGSGDTVLASAIFARSLEDKDIDGQGTIMAVIV